VEEHRLLTARQPLNALQTAEDTTARQAGKRIAATGLKQSVGGKVKRMDKANRYLGAESKPIPFVIGDEGLDDADAFGELHLGETALFAKAAEALAEGLFTGVDRGQVQA
jgi:hypothetical protein